MKRIGNLYNKICDFQNLHLAFHKVAKGRRYDPEVLKFKINLEENLIDLQNDLLNKTYVPAPYRTFTLYEPKERIIYVSAIRDRVVHHAVMNIIEPIWDKLFIYDSYACRRDKGTHAGVKKTVTFLRRALQEWGRVYCLKCDVSKFFPSINHHIMLSIIGKKIKCQKTLWLFEQIIFANSTNKDDPNSKNMPIGNLISQWAANLYLNELDYFMKHKLKMKYYIRYMDDFLVLHNSSGYLHSVKKSISDFLTNKLKLSLNPKSDIFPIKRGIDFLGYRIWHNNILIRKSSLIRATKRFRKYSKLYRKGKITREKIQASVASWLGHCKHANSINNVLKTCLNHLKS